MIDAAQLFHFEAATSRAAAGAPQEKQIPLVQHLVTAASFAEKDRMISELLQEFSTDPYQRRTTAPTVSHVTSLYPTLLMMASRKSGQLLASSLQPGRRPIIKRAL